MTPRGLMCFAAGFGTRMAPLTQDRPKPLIPVAGKPLLDHALDVAQAFAPLTAVVNAHYLAAQIVGHLAHRPITVSVEAPDILDTGGGLRQALPFLPQGPVFTMNTDMIWNGPNPLGCLARHWRAQDMDALLLCVPLARASGRAAPGDFSIDARGHLTRGGDFVYTGVQILNPTMLNLLSESERAFSLNRVWDAIAARQRLYAIAYAGHWCDVGQPTSIALAERMLRDV